MDRAFKALSLKAAKAKGELLKPTTPDVSLVSTLAFTRKIGDVLAQFADYKKSGEKNINSTLVLTSNNPAVTDLPKVAIFAQEGWNFPSLVFDDSVRFIGYWPADIGSDGYDFSRELETSQERTRDISTSLGAFREKRTIASAIEKIQELQKSSKSLAGNIKYDSEFSETKHTGYKNKDGREIVEFIEENKKTRLHARRQIKIESTSHNECHIRAKIHNIREVCITEEQDKSKDLFVKYQAIKLAEEIDQKKQEALANPEIFQKLVEFEEDNQKFIDEKIAFIEDKLRKYKNDSRSISKRPDTAIENQDLTDAFKRKSDKYEDFIDSPENRKIWLAKNISKLEFDLKSLKKEAKKLPKNPKELAKKITEKLSQPTKVTVYSKNRCTFTDLEISRPKLIFDIKKLAATKQAMLYTMALGQFSDKDFQEIVFYNPSLSDEQKMNLMHHVDVGKHGATTVANAAIMRGNLRLLQRLISESPILKKSINSSVTEGDETLLISAIKYGQKEIFDFLMRERELLDLTTPENKFALMNAARFGQTEMAMELLATAPEMLEFQHPSTKKTALNIAIESGNLDLAAKFLPSMTDLSYLDYKGRNLLHVACESKKDSGDLLEKLIERMDERSLPSLLNSPDGGSETPLFKAVKRGNLGAAQVLHAHKCSDKYLYLAAGQTRNLEVIKFCLDLDPSLENQMKILRTAAKADNKDVVEYLLNANESLLTEKIPDSILKRGIPGGATIVEYALLGDNPRIAKFLLKQLEQRDSANPATAPKLTEMQRVFPHVKNKEIKQLVEEHFIKADRATALDGGAAAARRF